MESKETSRPNKILKPEENLKPKEKTKCEKKPKQEENLELKEKSQLQEKFKSQSVKSNKIPTIDIKNSNKSANSRKRVVKEDISGILKNKLCVNKNKLEKLRAIKEVQEIINTTYMATETTTIARNQMQKKENLERTRLLLKVRQSHYDMITKPKKKLIQE